MKTTNTINNIFKSVAILFLLCCFIITLFRMDILSVARVFTASIIVYSLGIVLGLTIVIMYLSLFRKYKIRYGILTQIVVIVVLPFLIYGSLNYYKDLYAGITEFETENYKIPVESYYKDRPDIPKEIELSDYPGFCKLTISDEMYSDLIRNNPPDTTRRVYNAVFDETTHPHMHHIIIKFYKNTKIVDSIRIVYDE